MKISASLMSFNGSLAEKIHCIGKVPLDLVHVDYKSDFDLIQTTLELNKYFAKKDLHVVSGHELILADHTILSLLKQSYSYIFFQVENIPLNDVDEIFNLESANLAISVSTSLDRYKSIIQKKKSILLMSTTPGESGGVFDASTWSAINFVKGVNPSCRIYVDGGVNSQNFLELRSQGVHTAVVGSYFSKATSYNSRYHSLNPKLPRDCSLVSLSDPIETLPFSSNANLKSILSVMEEFRSNYVLVGDRGSLVGIITDGDLKRFVLKSNHIRSDPVIPVNESFLHMMEDHTVADLLMHPKFRLELGCIPLMAKSGAIRTAVDVKQIIGI